MTGPTPRPLRATLATGLAFFLVAVLVATRNPATSYELSIYGGTPLTFWVAIGLAFACAVVVLLHPGSDRWYRRGGFFLAIISNFAIVALPTLRGYYYYGAGDSLTHLGWIKALDAGTLDPLGFVYPGSHTIVLFIDGVAGLPYRIAVQLTVLVFFATYLFAFVMVVRATATYRHALAVGLLAAILWLPIKGPSVHRMLHPFSMGVLLLSFVLFLVVGYISTPASRRPVLKSPVKIGALLALASAATTIVHPQAGLVVVVLLGTMSLMQFGFRWIGVDHPIVHHRRLYGQTAFALAFFLVWSLRLEIVSAIIEATVQGILRGGEQAATEVSQRGSSLEAVGGSLPELFVKLFLPSVVFIALAGVYVLARWAGDGGWVGDDGWICNGGWVGDGGWATEDGPFVEYLAVAVVPVGVIFVVTFVAGVTTQHFRYLGPLMVLISLLGAIALSAAGRALDRARGPGVGTTVVTVFVILLLPLALLTVFSSPFIYQDSPHVTQSNVDGYETMVEHRAEGVSVTSIREQHLRYVDAILGRERRQQLGFAPRIEVNGTTFDGDIRASYDGQWYLPVSRVDYERDVVLYRGFRYSEGGFRSVDSSPGIHRVQSNGNLRVYLFNGTAGSG